MTTILTIALFTVLIHAAESLSYAVRLAGVRTGKYAAALSLTGIIVLVSRTSNMIQAPLLGSLIDKAREAEAGASALETHFRFILMSASFGTALAMLLLPTFVALSSVAVSRLEAAGSVPLMFRSVSIEQIGRIKQHLKLPKKRMLHALRIGGVPKRLMLLNAVGTAIYTVGVLSTLYAAALMPQAQMAAGMSSGLINGFATIIMTVLVDPQVALLTDKVMGGARSKSSLDKMFGLLLFSRLFGTLLAQALLLPGAYWIAWFSSWFA